MHACQNSHCFFLMSLEVLNFLRQLLAYHFQTCENTYLFFFYVILQVTGTDSCEFLTRNDIQVSLKKKYNDTYRSSKNLLSGNEWYCNQAFRALNQAIGMLSNASSIALCLLSCGVILLLQSATGFCWVVFTYNRQIFSSYFSLASFDDSIVCTAFYSFCRTLHKTQV